MKAEDLYDKEKVDLERVELEDVFTLLHATEEGLTTEQADERLTIFGPNKLESEEQNPFLQVCCRVCVYCLNTATHALSVSSCRSCGILYHG